MMEGKIYALFGDISLTEEKYDRVINNYFAISAHRNAIILHTLYNRYIY